MIYKVNNILKLKLFNNEIYWMPMYMNYMNDSIFEIL